MSGTSTGALWLSMMLESRRTSSPDDPSSNITSIIAVELLAWSQGCLASVLWQRECIVNGPGIANSKCLLFTEVDAARKCAGGEILGGYCNDQDVREWVQGLTIIYTFHYIYLFGAEGAKFFGPCVN